MPDLPTGGELVREMQRLSGKVEDSLNFLEAQSRHYAQAEDAYRLEKARLMLQAKRGLASMGVSKPTVAECEAWVDLRTSKERQEAHEAEYLMLAGREAVKARRAQLSALQSVAGIMRAEAELAKTGPNI